VRLHLQTRLGILPWSRVLDAFRIDGTSFLDVGCGHGLLAFLLRARGYKGSFTGIDIDERKTAIASIWLGGSSGIHFPRTPLAEIQTSGFDQAALLDVIYLTARQVRQGFVDEVALKLKPGGLLVALTSGGGPSWKRRLDRLEEKLAVGLGVTKGETVEPCDGSEIAGLFRGSGLEGVSIDYIGQGYAHGYELVLGSVPGGADGACSTPTIAARLARCSINLPPRCLDGQPITGD
jgi:SAM-dependent methyltransferase